MRREKVFVDYTIAGNGWAYTFQSFQRALEKFNAFNNLAFGIDNITLYGNKPDGTRVILDTKK